MSRLTAHTAHNDLTAYTHTIYIYICAYFGFATCNTKFINQKRQAWNIDVRKGLTTFPHHPLAYGLLLDYRLLKKRVVLLWGDIGTLWNSHWKTTRHALTARIVGLLTYPFPLSLFLFSFPLTLFPSYPWHPLIKQLQSKTLHTAWYAGWVTQHATLVSCWHEWESGRASRGASIIVRS